MIYFYMRSILLTFVMSTFCFVAHAQVSILEIQGESDVSPYVGQTVTFQAFVTEAFGDTWFMQDAYGAWNGIYVVGPGLVVPPNSPWWNEERPPEVGDELIIEGIVEEVDGNTQIMNASLVEQVEFWMATPAGIWLVASAFQDEQYEGTRVRIDGAEVVTEPDENGVWVVADATGELTCWGVDTDDPSNNEDPDGPSVGDIYQVYGALRQVGEEYVLMVGDIDVIYLSVEDPAMGQDLRCYPNPAMSGEVFTVESPSGKLIEELNILDANGKVCDTWSVTPTNRISISTNEWAPGRYHVVSNLGASVILVK